VQAEIVKLRSAGPTEAKAIPQEEAKGGDQLPDNKNDVKSPEDGRERSKTPVTQDQDAILKLELEMFQERLCQRDREINVLLHTLKQERKRADRAEGALTVAGIPMRTVSPASPDRLSPVHLSKKRSQLGSEQPGASRENLLPSGNRRDDTGQSLGSAGENQVGDSRRECEKGEAAGSDNAAASRTNHSSSGDWQAALKEGM